MSRFRAIPSTPEDGPLFHGWGYNPSKPEGSLCSQVYQTLQRVLCRENLLPVFPWLMPNMSIKFPLKISSSRSDGWKKGGESEDPLNLQSE